MIDCARERTRVAAAAILAAGLIGAALCVPLARVLDDADLRRGG